MAVTQQNVPAKLRHIQTFTSSGTFYPPAGTTTVFVSIHGASGGGGGGTARYGNSGPNGGAGGVGVISGAYVQVNPQAPHSVTIGSGGGGGNQNAFGAPNRAYANAGGTGGTTAFDGAIFNFGGSGGNAGNPDNGQSGNTGSSGSSNAQTSLTTLAPSNNALPRVSGVVNSGTTIAGGNRGTGNYGGQSGSGGSNAIIHIYGY